MRIAFISTMSAAPWGGSEVLWSQAAAEALTQGHEVFASVTRWPQLAPALIELQRLGVQLHQRPVYTAQLATRLVRRLQHALWVKDLEKSLAVFAADIICISQGSNFDIADMPALRQYLLSAGIPYYLVCHNYDASHLPSTHVRQAMKVIYAQARQVFFVSAEQATVSLRQLAQRFNNVTIVKNPINLAKAAMIQWPTSATMQLAIVGGLHIDFKGQDILLETLSLPEWSVRDWHLNIYGTGYDQEYIQELMTMYNLLDRVTIHGYAQDVALIWKHNHILVLPSRREAAPLVVMEAMLCARPVIGTAVGTLSEWVQPGVTGFLAAAATTFSFNAALEQAWQARANWAVMGQQAYQWACGHADFQAAATFLTLLTVQAARNE